MSRDPFAQLIEDVLTSMSAFIDRLPRAQRVSRVPAPMFLRNLRDEYRHVLQMKRYKEANEVLESFVRAAQDYRTRAGANEPYIRRWTAYEDQKLRKPIARLVRLHTESQKWEAMRRLRSSEPHFIKLPNGQKIQIADMTCTPTYDTLKL